MPIGEALSQFKTGVEHIRVAYKYFVACLPNEQMFANERHLDVGNFRFQNYGQVTSMKVELGWAFFTRLYDSFDAFTQRLGLDGPNKVYDNLRRSGRLSEAELNGIAEARELRNIFHHGDGDPRLLYKPPTHVRVPQDQEPHLFEEHVGRFIELFLRAADILDC